MTKRKPGGEPVASVQGAPGEIIFYQPEDGQMRIECRFENETIWLTQALLAELFQKDVRTINEHLRNIFLEGELNPEATVRKFRIVRQEGNREIAGESWMPSCSSTSGRFSLTPDA